MTPNPQGKPVAVGGPPESRAVVEGLNALCSLDGNLNLVDNRQKSPAGIVRDDS